MRNAFQRLAAPVAVGLGLAVVALVLNLGLQLSTVMAPGWLPFRLAGAGFENDIVQRIAAAESQYRDGSLRGEKFLCVLIGLSGLRESADLKTMTAASADRCRYLGLSGAGGAIDTLTEQTRRLLDGSLRPDVAVIGITDFLQVKPLPPQPGASEASPWTDAARRGDIRLLAKLAKDGLWFIERRRDVNGAVESALMDGKQTMLRVLGADAVSQLNPLTDPWREMIRLEVPEHASETALRNGIAAYQARALYEPASYERARIRAQTEALNELISKLRARNAGHRGADAGTFPAARAPSRASVARSACRARRCVRCQQPAFARPPRRGAGLRVHRYFARQRRGSTGHQPVARDARQSGSAASRGAADAQALKSRQHRRPWTKIGSKPRSGTGARRAPGAVKLHTVR